jgi:heterodisulfide reductase subunit A2
MPATPSERVTVSIDGRCAEVARGTTVLSAARQLGVSIPTLCHYAGISPYGACRICMVEIDTPVGPKLVASCSYPADEGLTVRTETDAVKASRQMVLRLLLAQAPDSPELIRIAKDLGVDDTPFEKAKKGKCIQCGLCVRVCSELMGRSAISIFGRGSERRVATAYGEPTEQCQACGACALVCPTGAIDLSAITARRPNAHVTRYDQGLTARPSIDLAHPQASPRIPAIDPQSCVHMQTGACGLCAKVCQAGAIDYEQKALTKELQVGAVVLAPGFDTFSPERRGEFGFGFALNVLTNVQFERMLSASGPSAGHLQRPSDGKAPRRLAFIQCIGSRDSACGNGYCSSVCCMAATKEAILAKEHEPGLEVTIFFLDMRAFGKDFERYYERAQKQLGVRYLRSFISRTYEQPGTRNLRLVYVNSEMKQVEEEFDLVVLSLGLQPSATLREQADRLGVALNQFGFAATCELDPLATSRPGVFVAGAFQEPKDIPDTVMQASAAAGKAMALLAPARGAEIRVKTYPPERDITDEPPRVGVFICHCGSNIASVVDVRAVVERTRMLPHVVYASHNLYTCADDNQQLIKAVIKEHGLNRVIVASCTPRTHEPIFRDTLRDAGLNPYLLEMANIRDQCSWVHSNQPARATEKAADLVRMAVSRVARLEPLEQATAPVENAALVVGGGVAGMTAALCLAEQGFPVHLIEKTERLGGTAERIFRTLDGQDVQAYLAQTRLRVQNHALIKVYTGSHISKVDGHLGGFRSTLVAPQGTRTIRHGAIVVATGASEYRPTSYGYGQDQRVLTQLELSERLGRQELDLPGAPTIVMIQCVEQRDEQRPYCSRVCCTTAVKNALALKERYPEARILVLYRDMRTYGFREVAYQKAREQGILFIRYEPERAPELDLESKFTLRIYEPTLRRELLVTPDLLVLAAPMVARADRHELGELLRVPLNADGFFLEAHMKLRPVDFASEGIFLCGTAHAPKFISETISQANAVAGRAASILSRKQIQVNSQIAWVDADKCVSCMTCLHVCPYQAPAIGPQNKAEIPAAVCMGCGSCASECPARAITLRNYAESQVMAAVQGLLQGAADPAGVGDVYPERAGVALPVWRPSSHSCAMEGKDGQ